MNYSKSWSFKKLLGIFFWACLVSSVFLLASCDKDFVSEKKEDYLLKIIVTYQEVLVTKASGNIDST